MAVALVQKRVLTGTATAAFTAPPTLGNLMVMVVGSNGTAQPPGFAADWRSADQFGPNGANDERGALVYKEATAADVSGNSWAISSFTTGTRGIIMYEFSGCGTDELTVLGLPAVANEAGATGTGPVALTLTGTAPTTDGVLVSGALMNASMSGEAMTVDGSATGVVVDTVGNPMAGAYKIISTQLTDAVISWDWTEDLRPLTVAAFFRGVAAPAPDPLESYPLRVRRGGAWVEIELKVRRSGAWV